MHAHKTRVVVNADHEVSVTLPSDFPVGEAELLVTAMATAIPGPGGDQAARDYREWLHELLGRLPPAPALPAEAFDRASFYDE